MRMVRQGAVRVDGERIEDPKARLESGRAHLLQVGKRRFARVSEN
nr:S4 domain-containing protein [Rhodocyclus tenuis]